MQPEQSSIYSDFLRILRRSTDQFADDPVREEIFSTEKLEQYAAYLATQLAVTPVPVKGYSLLPALRDSGRKLLTAYESLAVAIRKKQPFSPAAEWFVDNFHIVEDQLREIKEDLPQNYYDELPKLADGELKGYPRVYALALAFIAHTDCRLDAETLKRFINSFQSVVPLTIGELWAVAITLRIALVEHLKPLAIRVMTARDKRLQADLIADKLLEMAAKSSTKPEDLVKYLSSHLNKPDVMDRAFIVQLIARLRDQDPNVWPTFEWLEVKLRVYNTNTHAVTQLEHKRQASAQVTVGNIITSMRFLSTVDWRDFFESVSLVDPVLSLDPAGAYAKMDFATRDQYRHVIERISKQSRKSEIEIAKSVIALAREALVDKSLTALERERESHVGYFLIGPGLGRLEEKYKYRPAARERLFRFIRKYPTTFYLGSITALTLLFLSSVVKYLYQTGASPVALVIFSLIAWLPASEFALGVFNHYVTFFIKPRPLPKMDTKKGLPDGATTMVVVPTLFSSLQSVQVMIETLEVHYLANQDKHIYFALLSDFVDADTEVTPADEHLLKVAERGIEELNNKHNLDFTPGVGVVPATTQPTARFFLFHRKRQWNASEDKWIGWERKRGKLEEFNRLLRGARDTSYLFCRASPDLLAQVKYVITLDSDTQLPRDSAHQLVGTIIHPLNKPVYDERDGRVVEGYGILQPRVSVSLVSSVKTRFARIFSGTTGLDPYTTAVSDVYQDLFCEGSYTGKGLYVVDAFHKSLEGKIPENTLLSHDLFEGSYARSALVTDVEFFDDYPSDFMTYAKRQHRWTRGDWQIAQWLLPRVPTRDEPNAKNNLPLISKWKIFDNLRRSLIPVALLLWLFMAWTVLAQSALVLSGLMVFILIFPLYAPITNSVLMRRRGIPWQSHILNIRQEFADKVGQLFLIFTFLPDLAWVQTDAIVRTLYRKFVSHKKMLEWMTFAQVELSATNSVWERIGPAPVLAVFFAIFAGALHPALLPIAAPFLVLWFANPLIKNWSQDRFVSLEKALTFGEIKLLRKYARRTWHFFETFVSAEDNWLAPDNFQEDPKPIIAHRTSPTNIGLQLLAAASAFDFGYISLTEFMERVERTFATLEKLPRFHGHFFNWYDTRTLEALRPQYISTVDSGNLAGHLLAFKQACQEFINRPFISYQARNGLVDTHERLIEEIDAIESSTHSSTFVSLKEFREEIESCLKHMNSAPCENLFHWNNLVTSLVAKITHADEILSVVVADAGESEASRKYDEVRIWTRLCKQLLLQLQRDLKKFTPWTGSDWSDLPEETRMFLEKIPSLRIIPRAAKRLDPKASYMEYVNEGVDASKKVVERFKKIMSNCDQIVHAMDFSFLFDQQRKIFVIGFNVADGRRDNSYYDLLASESRLASFVAVAKGEVPQEHWFRLGRGMTAVKGKRALISWTATMFEYLMPLLVMKRYSGTLLDQTYKAVVERQIEYGKNNDVPWGVSEAGYNARDLQLNFQYGPFGVPGLGLKRGLSDDLVVSPYSTMLAAMIDPWGAIENLVDLEKRGVLARFGFFESIDYTSDRLQKTQKFFILRSFMAHHQGMSFVALNNVVNKNAMQRRFHAEPLVQATQLLLQERIPQNVPLAKPRAEEVRAEASLRFLMNPNPRTYRDIDLPTPRTQILSNGVYSTMISTAGAGYSRCESLALSRWREDVTRDQWGQFFYIRNRSTNKLWSAGAQPLMVDTSSYEVTFAEEKVEFWRRDEEITTHTEIIVSPEDNVELRRISLTNQSDAECILEITSYLEVVLARPADESAHPSFSNLFIQTEFSAPETALLATRRKRSEKEKEVWGFHVVMTDGDAQGPVQYETDRARFVGRGHSPADPQIILENRPLSNTVGAVLDPIFSLRRTLKLMPGQTARVLFASGLVNSRGEALRLADKYHDVHIFAREAELAWTRSQVQLRHMNIGTDKAHIYQRLAGRMMYSDPSLRPRARVLATNIKAQSALWAYGVSGDLPIILLRIGDEEEIPMVRELLHAHEYLRTKGLVADLVILNEHAPSYIQSLQDEVQRQVRMAGMQGLIDKPGGVFLRRADIMPDEDVTLLQTVARVVLDADKGTLEEQIARRPVEYEIPGPFVATNDPKEYPPTLLALPDLNFFNGLGGFSTGGRHYVITLKDGQWTPAPWINVIANSHDFGFIVSETGAGYTWSVNSRENRLTPWSNDAVTDPVGEAIYIRDEESGEFWSPTPLPIRGKETYLIKHAQGYTQFEHACHGIYSELQMFVVHEADVKISRLRLKNLGTQKRKLSVTSYVEWVLGFQKSFTSPFIITEFDPVTNALFARNPYNNEFASRVAFADMSEQTRSFTCDRKEFIGRNGSLQDPAAMHREKLSERTAAGLDPCAAFMTTIDLAPGEEKEILILLGQAESVEEARVLTTHYREHYIVRASFKRIINYWDDLLGTLQIKTPDEAMNTIVNKWLLYQTLSCRVWARSAFYQSGGAFGFRDQLQDVMALLYSKPQIAREHILRSAERQFREGDVQHWWHPPTGRGVRTKCSDDLLWLPFVTSHYVNTTGDDSILEELATFIVGPELQEGQDDLYIQPEQSSEKRTLLDHCLRTLDRSLKVGEHGLPLMGNCDWNDGMSRVGHLGKGESVWVAWFLYRTLELFIPFCESRGEGERATRYRQHMQELKNAVETFAWDGDWYRRAYFDNGEPLGSAVNEECKIDSLSQSWAILSGAGDPERAKRAMLAVDEYLVFRADGLIKLFTPPFDKSKMDPGYIKGYLPGVRENGGQYTHAAVWTVMAYAAMKDGERASELYALINPINHASTPAGLYKYKVEPYVAAADIYGMHPHVGRGGWTWYTGSASWMYRAAVESILGFELRGNTLRIQPAIPKHWHEYEINYVHKSTPYKITVRQLSSHLQKTELTLDGQPAGGSTITLADDKKPHTLLVELR